MAREFTLTLDLDSHPEFRKNRDGLIGAVLTDMGGKLLSGKIDLDHPEGNSITRGYKAPGISFPEVRTIGSMQIIDT